MVNILYEDNHLIAVYKPTGMLVQGDHSGDPTLMDEVKYFIKQRDGKSGNVFLGMLHRLDRPVSGIVLFAKTSKGAARLSEQFRNKTIEKTYHALVIGVPKKRSARLVHYLIKDPDKNVVYAYDRPVEGAREAVLEYEVIDDKQVRPSRSQRDTSSRALLLFARGGFAHWRKRRRSLFVPPQYSLLKIRLETGRPHQIRAQLAAIGHPIVGDVKYGAPIPLPDRSLALCATSLTFQLATKDENMTVSVPIPDDWARQYKE